jgi:hypothetical protein
MKNRVLMLGDEDDVNLLLEVVLEDDGFQLTIRITEFYSWFVRFRFERHVTKVHFIYLWYHMSLATKEVFWII